MNNRNIIFTIKPNILSQRVYYSSSFRGIRRLLEAKSIYMGCKMLGPSQLPSPFSPQVQRHSIPHEPLELEADLLEVKTMGLPHKTKTNWTHWQYLLPCPSSTFGELSGFGGLAEKWCHVHCGKLWKEVCGFLPLLWYPGDWPEKGLLSVFCKATALTTEQSIQQQLLPNYEF